MVLMATRKKAEMATTAIFGPSPKGSAKIKHHDGEDGDFGQHIDGRHGAVEHGADCLVHAHDHADKNAWHGADHEADEDAPQRGQHVAFGEQRSAAGQPSASQRLGKEPGPAQRGWSC